MNQSLTEIKTLLSHVNDREDPRVLALQKDPRKSVQAALNSFEKRLLKQEKRAFQFQQMQAFENIYYEQGVELIAGVDEVGRGPLAGDVVAAAVILPKDIRDLGFDDSKKLSAAKRKEVYEAIQEHAIAIGVGVVSAEIIDEINILEATKIAMIEALKQLSPQPQAVLIDALLLNYPLPQEKIIKGDARSISIAAASIVAKQVRDEMMVKYHQIYPYYGFDRNAGYGTKEHLDGLAKYGPCPIHRKSFSPVTAYFEEKPLN